MTDRDAEAAGRVGHRPRSPIVKLRGVVGGGVDFGTGSHGAGTPAAIVERLRTGRRSTSPTTAVQPQWACRRCARRWLGGTHGATASRSTRLRSDELAALSKSRNVTGWHLGFVAGNATVVEGLRRLKS